MDTVIQLRAEVEKRPAAIDDQLEQRKRWILIQLRMVFIISVGMYT
jgi:hypothetical protein